MKNLINIKTENGRQLVSARELHEFLESGQDFTTWIKARIEKYDFTENVDFTLHKFVEGKVWKHDYAVTLNMAKELSMVENNDKGKEARKYFIVCEEKAKQQVPQLSKELQAIFLLDKRTMEIDNRITSLENTMTIDYAQQENLNILAKKTVIQALGGYGTPAYKELNKKAFSAIWRDYKRVMNVNSYKNTAVVEFEKGKQYLSNWKPERELELMIVGANSQVSM